MSDPTDAPRTNSGDAPRTTSGDAPRTMPDDAPRTMSQDVPRTMFEKIWDRHRVLDREDGQTLLYVDRHLLHDGGATAFDVLR
ncbi:MAG: 3-isopropylmalate dehydratase large subunit, partial [Belnapia sp.]|nr:3-isopropylmalate dehydratase large subunit [Belnapia sp.]